MLHSLGGIILEDAITLSASKVDRPSKQIDECTKAIAFLGTPHQGSDLAAFASSFATLFKYFKRVNKTVVKSLKPKSEIVWRVEQDFASCLAKKREATKKGDGIDIDIVKLL